MSASLPEGASLPLDPTLRSRSDARILPRAILPQPDTTLGRAASSSAPQGMERHKKRPRTNVTIACDGCKQARARCNGETPCSRCDRRSLACKYDNGNDRRQNRVSNEELRQLSARLAKYQHLISALQTASAEDTERMIQLLKEESNVHESGRPRGSSGSEPSSWKPALQHESSIESVSFPSMTREESFALIGWIKDDIQIVEATPDSTPMSLPSLSSFPSTMSTMSSLEEALPPPATSEPKPTPRHDLSVQGLLS